MAAEKKDMAQVLEFVEEYNRYIGWNLEVREKMGISFGVNDTVDAIVDEYLSTEKITSEEYDIANAVAYEYGDTGTWEIQIYSDKEGRVVYFWCKRGLGREEYIKGEVERVTKDAMKCRDEAATKVMQLNNDIMNLDRLMKGIEKINKK